MLGPMLESGWDLAAEELGEKSLFLAVNESEDLVGVIKGERGNGDRGRLSLFLGRNESLPAESRHANV
jgi:hypothetical protein